ncbi:hypothetical protein C7A11_12875 [Pseudomonas simiae]|nr:hypothetical protein C7A11_12875 [Pseudomonas simiae]
MSEKGYGAETLDDIAQIAGPTRGAIYGFFNLQSSLPPVFDST